MNGLPYTQECYFSHAYTTANISLSMLAYRVSVSVSALEANDIGLSSCRRAAPNPLSEASTCMTVVLFGSK